MIARELVALPADVLVTSNPYATQAAREASHIVPIVVALDYETDPVARGWIASIARPGGNVTGLFLDQPEMTGKLLELLKEAVPAGSRVAVLWDETIGRSQFETTQEAARVKGLTIRSLGVRRAEDLAEAFEAAARERADCLIMLRRRCSRFIARAFPTWPSSTGRRGLPCSPTSRRSGF